MGAVKRSRTNISIGVCSAAIVVVTHHLHEGLALASHAAVMRTGRFVRFEDAAGLDPVRYADDYRELVA